MTLGAHEVVPLAEGRVVVHVRMVLAGVQHGRSRRNRSGSAVAGGAVAGLGNAPFRGGDEGAVTVGMTGSGGAGTPIGPDRVLGNGRSRITIHYFDGAVRMGGATAHAAYCAGMALVTDSADEGHVGGVAAGSRSAVGGKRADAVMARRAAGRGAPDRCRDGTGAVGAGVARRCRAGAGVGARRVFGNRGRRR